MSSLPRFGFASTLCLLAFAAASCAGEAESAEDMRGVPAESPATDTEAAAAGTQAVDDAAAEQTPAVPQPAAAPRPTATARPSRPAAPAVAADAEPLDATEPVEDMPEHEPVFVPAGTSLTFAMEAPISTSANKVGDMFSATLVADLLGEDGRVLLPQGAVLLGRVTESAESPSSDKPAVLRIAIESIDAGGVAYPVFGEVEKLEMETATRESDRRTAAKVTAGAAVGAIAGRIAGRTKTGAVAGAAAGAAVAIASKDGQATIPAGAQLIVRLSERLVIR